MLHSVDPPTCNFMAGTFHWSHRHMPRGWSHLGLRRTQLRVCWQLRIWSSGSIHPNEQWEGTLYSTQFIKMLNCLKSVFGFYFVSFYMIVLFPFALSRLKLKRRLTGMMHCGWAHRNFNIDLTTSSHATATLLLRTIWIGCFVVGATSGMWSTWQLWFFSRVVGWIKHLSWDPSCHSS